MCRSMMESGDLPYSRDRDRLNIRAFVLRLTLAGGRAGRRIPEALTLVYLPRVSGGPMEVNGAKIRMHEPAFVALHRTRTAEVAGSGEAVFASTDRVRAGEGVRFEVYVGVEPVIKGVVRRGEKGMAVECRCAMEVDPEGLGVSSAEVCVAGESEVLARERVELAERRWRGRRGFRLRLEEIPEEGEEEEAAAAEGGEEEEEGAEEGWEMLWADGGEDEGMRWAVDVGIWVVCLGVGFLACRASSKSWRRRRII